MARYISPFFGLTIYTKPAGVSPPINDVEPKALAKFYNGELIIGDPKTDTGPGNDLDWSLAWDVFSGANDREKAGLGKTFFYAPYIDSSGSLTSGNVYIVIKGSIEHDNATYTEGETFEATATSFTDVLPGSIVALAIHSKNFPKIGFEVSNIYQQDLSHWYIVNQLGFTDSSRQYADWDKGNWRGRTKPSVDPWKFVS